MTTYRIERARDSQDLARMAAQTIASYLDLALDQRDRAQLALSGGSTPAVAYGLLGQEHLPWKRVDVFLGDERWVDADDPSSNARMLRQTLLHQAPGSHAAFHPVPTVSLPTPEDSATAFQAAIEKVCPGEPPIFDLMVLGLGEDGHTASLFPGTEAPMVTDRWTTVGRGKGLERITLTAPVLSASRQVIFLVSGAGKAQALARLLDPAESPQRTPAKLVTPRTEVLVLADEAALAGGAAAG
ncbi:6-phosphogluconolactonase [Synechococcus sp. LTW-R]|uniref:6-phosphogluconolactonase n=1 Tax=Synechococcus sp. LTW-R TaxID=2751170 RepID=UPI0016251C03|nr:6-phosphogluconolactonase [Synechococcus sp. LTW-R]QNG30181.1 6-phosphogluconolactonase [Synechococcus sp. LTW-R]